MTLKNVLDGIEILQRYITKEPDKSWPFAAEHDILYFNTDKPVKKKDIKILEELGWSVDDEYGDATNFYAYV